MEQHKEPDVRNQNDKEEITSSSPDSGLNLSYDEGDSCGSNSAQNAKDSEKSSSPPTKRLQCNPSQSMAQNTLYPFFYKYPDNRKLTLLKSLSQDSEYSLDTSLFDAEDFLQEMGFAGSGDPTIPERFLPSLIQRLSKFPESEIESLNDRIVQSIGCFKRKEGKRRLFRNLSMGKDSRQNDYNVLSGSMCNNYPLIRSNTGPASFSFNNQSSNIEANHECQDSRPSLSNSNNSSFSEETLLPESPIAILVSAASEDHEDKILEEEPLFKEEISNSDEAAPADIEENESAEFFNSNDDELVNYTNSCTTLESDVTENITEPSAVVLKNEPDKDCYLKEEQESFNNSEPKVEEENSREENGQLKFEEVSSMVVNSHSTTVPNEKEHSASPALNSFSIVPTNVFSVLKTPLRRLSHTTEYNRQNFNCFDSLLFEDKPINNDDNSLTSEMRTDETKEENPIKVENDNSVFNDSSFEGSESTSSLSGKDDTDSVIGLTKQDLYLSSISENKNLEPISDSFVVEVRQPTFSRPKYTRDDSLTNFLTSMLDTNDTLSPSSPVTGQVFNFDCTEIQNLPNPSTQSEISVKTEISGDKISQNVITTDFIKRNSHAKEKVPNRKRRMLRRMSSSINHHDEEASVTNSESSNYVSDPLQTLSPPFISSSHQPLRNTCSAPQTTSCETMYPCCYLPSVRLCSCYETCRGNMETSNAFNWSSQCAYNTRNQPIVPTVSPSNRKFKRRCSHNRYLSCPPSMTNFNLYPLCTSQKLSVSDHYLNLDTSCDHTCHHYPSPYSRYFHSQQEMFCNVEFENRASTEYQSGYSSDPQSPGNWRGISKSKCSHSHRNSFCFLHPTPNSSPSWKSKDYSYGSIWKSTPNISHESELLLSNADSYRQSKSRRSRNSCQKQSLILNPHTLTSTESQSYDDVFLPASKNSQFSGREARLDCYSKSKDFDDFQESSSLEDRDIPDPKHLLTTKQNEENQFIDVIESALPNKKQSVKEHGSFLTTVQRSKLETNCKRNPPLKISNSYPLEVTESSWNNVDRKSNWRVSSYANNIYGKSDDSENKLSLQNNKREALYEKKIRAFSKFLNNLTKSTLGADFNNDDRNVNPSKDIFLQDETIECLQSNTKFKDTPGDESLTASPELDKLVKLLNSMEFNKIPQNDIQDTSCISKTQKNKNSFPIYENKVSLEMTDSDQGNQACFTPVSYTSSISIQINCDDKELQSDREEKKSFVKPVIQDDSFLYKRSDKIGRYSLQMSFKEVSKELEELQLSIQKAKEMRMSASKELHLLQELLSRDAFEYIDSSEEKNSSKVTNTSRNKDLSTYMRETDTKALSDLRKKSEIGETDDAEFWQKEIKKIKEENDQAWRAKFDILEQRLASQEKELQMVQSVNENLQRQLELQTLEPPSCHCRTDVVQNGFGRIDSAFEDDEEYLNHKSSIPIQSSRQECERLQKQLSDAEQRADQLNLLLNQKLIELNKLQLTLSKQTKEMIELEKSYLQLQCKLRKGTSKPVVAKLCSRTSPFNSKNLFPKPSPPASPHPNGVS